MSEQKIEIVPVDQIVPLPYNVCRMDSETELMLRTDMTRVETVGMYKIDPILLRRLTPEEIEEYKKKGKLNARYMIVDGHRRWNAAVELGWHEIRAVITDMSLDEAREFNYKKNKIRGTVDPMREAAYFRYLHDVKKMTVDQIAEKFGISHKEVDRILSRIRVSPEVRKMISEGSALTLSPTHYEILGSIPEPEKQKQMAEIIAKEELSVREAEIAKTAIEKGLPPEKTVKIVKTVKREKLAPKEAKVVVEALAKKPEAETLLELPKPKLVEEAKKIVTPPPTPPAPPKSEEEEMYVCPVCGSKLKLVGNVLVPA
jgi:ParB/RepB/Spo0J family partition protein